jgi:hypothetical protein
VVDICDSRKEAQCIDAGGVRESRGAADERKTGDRNAVDTEELKGLVRAIDIRGAGDRRWRLLHLHDHGTERLWVRLHQGEQRRIDLFRSGRLRARRGGREHERESQYEEGAGDRERPARVHSRSVTASSARCSTCKGSVKQKVLP